jgi:hypothetical protein
MPLIRHPNHPNHHILFHREQKPQLQRNLHMALRIYNLKSKSQRRDALGAIRNVNPFSLQMTQVLVH